MLCISTSTYIYSIYYYWGLVEWWSVDIDDVNETVKFPNVATVRTQIPPLNALLALCLGTVRADAGGVVVAADDAGGAEPPGRVL